MRSTRFNPGTAARSVGAAGHLPANATTDGDDDGEGDVEGEGAGDCAELGELEGEVTGDSSGDSDSTSVVADGLDPESPVGCGSEPVVDSAEMTAARAVRASVAGDASTVGSSELFAVGESSDALGAGSKSSPAVDDGVELGVDVVGDGRVLIDASHSGASPSVDNASFDERVDEVLESLTESAAFAGGAFSKETDTAKQATTEAPMRMRALASDRPRTPARTARATADLS